MVHGILGADRAAAARIDDLQSHLDGLRAGLSAAGTPDRLLIALGVAIFAFGMPTGMAISSAFRGGLFIARRFGG